MLPEQHWIKVTDNSTFPPYNTDIWVLVDQIIVGSENIKPMVIRGQMVELDEEEKATHFGQKCEFVCNEEGPFENVVIDGNRYDLIAWRHFIPRDEDSV